MRNIGGMPGDPTPDGVPERVVQATIRLLAEQGPSAIKARSVASASGLSTMAVYHHFGGIAELIRAVVGHGFTRRAIGRARTLRIRRRSRDLDAARTNLCR